MAEILMFAWEKLTNFNEKLDFYQLGLAIIFLSRDDQKVFHIIK